MTAFATARGLQKHTMFMTPRQESGAINICILHLLDFRLGEKTQTCFSVDAWNMMQWGVNRNVPNIFNCYYFAFTYGQGIFLFYGLSYMQLAHLPPVNWIFITLHVKSISDVKFFLSLGPNILYWIKLFQRNINIAEKCFLATNLIS